MEGFRNFHMRNSFAWVVLKLLALVMLLCLIYGCSALGVFSPKAKAEIVKIEADLVPLIGKAQTALTAVQADYPFWSALVQGSLQVVGVKVTQAQMNAALPYIAAADTDLGVLGKAMAYNQNPSTAPAPTAADLQNAISSTTTALPVLKTTVLANPAVAALYQAYVAGQTNLPAPTAAAAVPTS